MLSKSLKTLLASVMLVSVLISCGSSKNATVSDTKRSNFKGTWVLENITYDGIADESKVKMTLLDEGDKNCLIGSSWYFPNSGKGTYTIADGATCAAGARDIVWGFRKENGNDIFQYKVIEAGEKANRVADGYKFVITDVTKEHLQLQSAAIFEGKTIYINYHFGK